MSDRPLCDQDRIKLAKAMGWTLYEGNGWEWVNPDGVHTGIHMYSKDGTTGLPDPFTDANDDYAVLEWMREKDGFLRNDRLMYHLGQPILSYQIGDYARAALKVI